MYNMLIRPFRPLTNGQKDGLTKLTQSQLESGKAISGKVVSQNLGFTKIFNLKFYNTIYKIYFCFAQLVYTPYVSSKKLTVF